MTPEFEPPLHVVDDVDPVWLKAVVQEIADREGVGESWAPVDLTSVLNGTYEPPQPTVGRRDDGAGLLYPGRQHTVASESEAGKSWLALAICTTELARGNSVLYIDFEDDEGGIVGRLLSMGVPSHDIRDRFVYIRPEDPIGGIGSASRLGLAAALGDLRPVVVILDGVTEGMVLHGLSPLSNEDCATFGRLIPRPIAKQGAAVASLDHVTKNVDTRGRYAIGAVHKLNGLNGAAYLLENKQPFGIGLVGKSTLRIAKDRPGQLRRNGLRSVASTYWYGDLTLDATNPGFIEASIAPPQERDPGFRPTHLMAKISHALATHGKLSQRKILTLVGGNRQNVINALTFLIIDGYVTDETPHELIKPYVDTE